VQRIFLGGFTAVALQCTLRPGKKGFLRPHQQKLPEFEVKNRRKSEEEAKAEHFLCCNFRYFSKQ